MRWTPWILSDESLSYSLKHISTEEHSLHISWRSIHLLHLYFLFSWWRHQMATCSASLALVWGIQRWLRGIHRSPVNSPHIEQWTGVKMFSLICAWTNGWVKNSRSRWFDTPSRSLWRHCNVVPNCDPVIRASMGSFCVQRVTLVQFWMGETDQMERGGGGCSVHYGRNGLKFGTLLYPDYHSLKLTIFCTPVTVWVCGVRSSIN